MDRSIILLDCTLRDGGYYNAWDFSPELISSYLKALAALPADVVEIGFRFMPGTRGRFLGGCAYSTDDFIQSFDINRKLRVAVMVNGADLVKAAADPRASIDRLFQPAGRSPVEIVRIACHVDGVEEALPAVDRLNELGYKTTVNMMQIAGVPEAEVERLAELAATHPLDVLYFADSLGGMEPDDVSDTVKALRKNWKGEIGFHAHNNMELALANCIRAVDEGVSWIDGTVLGMGRGPGNTRTEYLAIELETRFGVRAMNYTPLFAVVNHCFKPMQQQFGWGPNPFYYLAGKYGIHPTYVQEMQGDSRYDEEDILAGLEHLDRVGGRRYKTENLEAARSFYVGSARGSCDAREVVSGKTALILGSGPGAAKHRDALEEYIRKRHPVVIALNRQSPIEENLIDVRAACHPVRILADWEEHLGLPQPLIVPFSMLPARVQDLLKGKSVLDYGIEVRERTFEYHARSAVIPFSLVIAYALAFANSGHAERILLAGFDGYGLEDPRTQELNEMFDLYFSSKASIPAVAVSPTQYRIPQMSIHDPGL